MDSNELKRRTKQFALRCIKMSHALPDAPLGRHVRGQIIRSSTSVAANYRAACLAQSKAGFVAKLSIVVEEVDETLFWFEIIIEENMLPQQKVEPLMQEADELTAIFITARKTARKNCPSSIVHR
ncbi:MAG TPA: four helix bundle protein, partial [Phycisphaerales bacterium]|nr:four helix bundle protein [Phycisphaerales bacterium]